MISRALLVGRRLFSTDRHIPFNLSESFKYLTKSDKYKHLAPVAQSLSHHKTEVKRSFESSRFDTLKSLFFDLDLSSRLALCDALQYEIFHLADSNSVAEEEESDENGQTQKPNEFKSYYSHDDHKFKQFLHAFLRSNLRHAVAKPQDRTALQNSLSPKWYLKLLYYYARFHFSDDLAEDEIDFLEGYPSSAASDQYDYDMHELVTLAHCFYKLNLRMDRPFFDRYMNKFFALSQTDQLTFFYTTVKLVRHQLYFDEKFLALVKATLRGSHHLLPYNSAVSVAAALACLGYYDQELLELIAQIVAQVANLRFKDITKLIWAFSFLGFDLRSEPKLLHTLINQLKTLENERLRYTDGVKDSIDLIKSLIYLNIYDFGLIDLFLNDPSINAAVRMGRTKTRNDLFFILKSLEIEHPRVVLTNRPLYQLAEQPAQNLQRELRARRDYPNFVEFYRRGLPTAVQFRHKVVYPLPHMNLSSVLVGYVEGGRRTSVLLDLLDSSNTLPGHPDRIKGVYKTKLRQMTVQGLDFVLFRKVDDRNYLKVDHWD